MIHDNETNNQTSGLHAIAEQQKQLSRPSEYTLPHPFSMGERPKNIDRDDVPSRDVNRRVGGDEKFGVKYEKKNILMFVTTVVNKVIRLNSVKIPSQVLA